MRHQPTRKELRQRMSVTKQALIDADTQGMQVHDILALLSVDQPYLTRDTLAVWIADHQARIQAVRGRRTVPGGYIWYHRHHTPAPAPAPAPKAAVRSAPTQRAPRPNRVIILTVPTLPRLTRLRAYSLVVTVYAVTITALEVL